MKITVYAIGGTARTKHVARAMMDGFTRHGIYAVCRDDWQDVEGEVAIAYGWNHAHIFNSYKNKGRQFVYWDMGYWDRRPERDKKNGYHRLAVNDWDTAKTMMRSCPSDRLAGAGIELLPWRSRGAHIILAGMSGKAAGTHGFHAGQWERETAAAIMSMTSRPIVVRAKPVGSRQEIEPIADALSRAHMVISHHSNVAVDALIAGVPFWAKKGVGALFSPPAITQEFIENPPLIADDVRRGMLADVAYSQWRPSEMRTGRAWDHIKCILRST